MFGWWFTDEAYEGFQKNSGIAKRAGRLDYAVTIDESLPNGSYYIRVALFGGGTHTYRGRLEP